MKQLKIGLLVAVLFSPTFLWAQAFQGTMSDPETLLGPRAAARAGTTGASELYFDSLLQNPASSAFQSQYAMSGNYLGAGDALGAAIVDTKSGPVGGGAYYIRRNLKSGHTKNPLLGNYPATEERAGISSMGKINQQIGLGFTGKWAYRKSFQTQVAGGKAFNLDVGLRYAIAPTVVAGFLGQNLFGDDKGLYLRTFQFAIEWQAYSDVRFSGNLVRVSRPDSSSGMTLPKNDKLVNWALGVEYAGWDSFALRGGYAEKASWDQNYFSLGFGYDAKTFQIDYSFEKQLRHSKEQIHRVGLTGFI